MSKINGYTEEEARELVAYVEEGRRRGKTLTALFAAYGLEHGRARGSVRNYYYALMKNEKKDERIVKLLDGTQLSVGKIRAFTEEEADEVIRSILLEKAKGMSVRKAIFTLSGGDDKLMLRLQNKYRNILKKNPERIAKMARELFGENAEAAAPLKRNAPQTGSDGNVTEILKKEEARELLQRRLEREINALYDRLTKALKAENQRLKEENELLRGEVERLRTKLH
ncbi:MAG: hypothetical protein IJX98_06490 [Clostridia bacterium]|nr:hypothetical protein [Clostridia bacterium]